MKRMLIGIAAIASLFTSSAFAADLGAQPYGQPYAKTPVYVEPVYVWTGFYLGANVGYSWGRSKDTSTLTNGAGTLLFVDSLSTKMEGALGGGQVGYNWQMQNWLFGLEGDIQGTFQRGEHPFTCPTGICTPLGGIVAVVPGPAVPVALNQSLDWFGTVRGRVGILPSPKIMVYATGGLAYGQVNSSALIAGLTTNSVSKTQLGWTAGAGVEGALGGNWTLKIEYLYVDLGKTSGAFTTTVGALGGGTLAVGYNSRVTDHIARLGVNYRFGGPIVASY